MSDKIRQYLIKHNIQQGRAFEVIGAKGIYKFECLYRCICDCGCDLHLLLFSENEFQYHDSFIEKILNLEAQAV